MVFGKKVGEFIKIKQACVLSLRLESSEDTELYVNRRGVSMYPEAVQHKHQYQSNAAT